MRLDSKAVKETMCAFETYPHCHNGIISYGSRMRYKPPDFTRIKLNCRYRSESGSCLHAKNYLRHIDTDSYCVVLLDEWLHDLYPELDDQEVSDVIVDILKLHREKQR